MKHTSYIIFFISCLGPFQTYTMHIPLDQDVFKQLVTEKKEWAEKKIAQAIADSRYTQNDFDSIKKEWLQDKNLASMCLSLSQQKTLPPEIQAAYFICLCTHLINDIQPFTASKLVINLRQEKDTLDDFIQNIEQNIIIKNSTPPPPKPNPIPDPIPSTSSFLSQHPITAGFGTCAAVAACAYALKKRNNTSGDANDKQTPDDDTQETNDDM